MVILTERQMKIGVSRSSYRREFSMDMLNNSPRKSSRSAVISGGGLHNAISETDRAPN